MEYKEKKKNFASKETKSTNQPNTFFFFKASKKQ